MDKTKTFQIYIGMHSDLGDETIILVDEAGSVYTLSSHDQPLEDFFDFDQVKMKKVGDKMVKELPAPVAAFEVTGYFKY